MSPAPFFMTVTQRRQSGPSPMYREESWGAELSVEAENPNRNVNWMGRKEFWAFYVLCILGFRFLLSWFLPTAPAWTVTSIVHAVVRGEGGPGAPGPISSAPLRPAGGDGRRRPRRQRLHILPAAAAARGPETGEGP